VKPGLRERSVEAEGEATAWNGDGITRALRLIDAGGPLPDVTGATGALRYSKRLPLELTSSTFALWEIRGPRIAPSNVQRRTVRSGLERG